MNNNTEFKKKLRDEIRYIKDLLDSKENELLMVEKEDNSSCCECDSKYCCCNSPMFEWDGHENRNYSEYDDETDICHVSISINVECDDEDLKEIIETELYEKAEELHRIFDCEDNAELETEEISVDVNVSCEDEDLANYIGEYISDEINELIEEAVMEYYSDEFDEECDCEDCKRERKRDEFEDLAKPLIKFLNNNYHPHASIIITPDSAEILSGEMAFQTDEFIRD